MSANIGSSVTGLLEEALVAFVLALVGRARPAVRMHVCLWLTFVRVPQGQGRGCPDALV